MLTLCLTNHKVFEEQYSMEFSFGYNHDDYKIGWDNDLTIFEVPTYRKFEEINLTGDDKQDKVSLKYAQHSIRQLALSKDTINGVQIHFSDESKYWAFVQVLNICQLEKRVSYYYENSLWVFNWSPKPNIEPLDVKSIHTGFDIVYVQREITWKDRYEDVKEHVELTISFVKEYWMSTLLFSFMVFLTSQKYIHNKATI